MAARRTLSLVEPSIDMRAEQLCGVALNAQNFSRHEKKKCRGSAVGHGSLNSGGDSRDVRGGFRVVSLKHGGSRRLGLVILLALALVVSKLLDNHLLVENNLLRHHHLVLCFHQPPVQVVQHTPSVLLDEDRTGKLFFC